MRTTTRVPPREPRPNSSFVASLRARPGRGIAAAFIGALFVTFITLVALTPTGVPVVVPIALQQLWVANHPGTQVPGSTVARIDMTAEHRVGQQFFDSISRYALQDPPGTVRQFPRVRIQLLPDLVCRVIPRPTHIEGEFREGPDPLDIRGQQSVERTRWPNRHRSGAPLLNCAFIT